MRNNEDLYFYYLLNKESLETNEKLQKGLRPGEIYKCVRCKRPITFDEVKIRNEEHSSLHFHGAYNTISYYNCSLKLCLHCYKHKKKVDKWFKYIFWVITILAVIISVWWSLELGGSIIEGLCWILIIGPVIYGGHMVTKSVFTIIDDLIAKYK